MKLKPLGANRSVASFENGVEVLFSYSTPVAAFVPGEGYYRTETTFSRTTNKHIGQWKSNIVARKPQEFFEGLVGSK